LGLSLVLYHSYQAIKGGKPRIINLGGILLGLMMLFLLRNFIIVVLIPAATAWLLAVKFPRRALACFLSVYVIFIFLFFSARYLNPSFDLPAVVVSKQQAFLKLRGTSSIAISEL